MMGLGLQHIKASNPNLRNLCNLRILNLGFGLTYPRLTAAQSARLACTRAKCALKSADA
jgi:hypothetical protein